MYKICICDDESKWSEDLRRMLIRYFNGDCSIQIFNSADDLSASIANGARPDIALLDIQIGADSGIELAKKLFPAHSGTSVIFITGYMEYCTAVYETDHIYFLLKPVTAGDLYKALQKATRENREEKPIAVRSFGQILSVRPSEILFVESCYRKLRFHLAESTIESYGTIPDISEKLGACFFQCHKSFLVNFASVRSMTSRSFLLENDKSVPISQKRFSDTKAAYLHYLNGFVTE